MAATIPPHAATLADLLDRLGHVPLERIRLPPWYPLAIFITVMGRLALPDA